MKSYPISDDMKKGPASALMDLMAERMVEFAAECGESMRTPDGGEEPTLGFCFSFPVSQTALDAGTLIRWTKGAGRTCRATAALPSRTSDRAAIHLQGCAVASCCTPRRTHRGWYGAMAAQHDCRDPWHSECPVRLVCVQGSS